MTTIAFKDGIMAADSGAWAGDASNSFAYKLAVGQHNLYGVSGNAAECQGFIDWVNDGEAKGMMPKPRPIGDYESSFIVMRASGFNGKHGGVVSVLTAHGEEEYETSYYAIGAGAQAAMAAMYVGASARKAIKAAKAHASGAFGKVHSIEFPHP